MSPRPGSSTLITSAPIQASSWVAVGAAWTCPRSRMRTRSEEHTSELQSPCNLVCRLLLEKKKNLLTRCLDWTLISPHHALDAPAVYRLRFAPAATHVLTALVHQPSPPTRPPARAHKVARMDEYRVVIGVRRRQLGRQRWWMELVGGALREGGDTTASQCHRFAGLMKKGPGSVSFFFFFLMMRPPPTSPLSPSTTLSR